MGRYDSHKFPFHYQMNQWSSKRINTSLEKEAKSIPCHVVKVEKDFIHVAFETQNGIFTPPTVKIPQSMSPYGREPTQKGDRGVAIPGNYYQGGVTDDAGGRTDFYPRGNLTTINFQPVSHKKNKERDYDQHTQMGGPNGWIVGPYTKTEPDPKQDQQSQGGAAQQQALMLRPAAFLHEQKRARNRLGIVPYDVASTSGTSSGDSQSSSSQQKDDDKTQFSFDKDKKAVVQSKDEEHILVVDSKSGKAYLQSKSTAHVKSGKVYIGDAPDKGSFARIMTEDGPSSNSYAKIG